MSIEAMKQALEAMEKLTHHFTRTPSNLKDSEARGTAHATITALRTAIEQAGKQEPVAWLYVNADMPTNRQLEWTEARQGYAGNWVKYPLYAAPQSISKGKEKA